MYRDSHAEIRRFLGIIFERDFRHEAFVDTELLPQNLIVSPLNSRKKIENFIASTKNEILIYVQTVSDKSILRILENLHKEGKKVILCTAKNEGNSVSSEYWPYDWYFAERPYLHAKIMVRDREFFFL